MARVILFVLDSVGIGGAADAHKYGDLGSDTVGNIARACAAGGGNQEGLRSGELALPNLDALGLGSAAALSTGKRPPNLDKQPIGGWGVAVETSVGKDTPSGHWEIAGVPVHEQWTLFPKTVPAFPQQLIDDIVRQGGLPGVLGNKHASGMDIIHEFGDEHLRTGKPIFYTSADSVLQIAAHETEFGLERLYQLCETARKLTIPLNVGRVIARPFVGYSIDSFSRTGNRRDYTIPPPQPTLLDRLTEAGNEVIGMGKIGDIFAHRGLSQERKAHGNMPLLDATLTAIDELQQGGLLFANFVDFDSEYGHPRDVAGYAAALEQFDARLPEVYTKLISDDILIITADHGNDPTWSGNDHTREQVPILLYANKGYANPLGKRLMSDIGASIGEYLGVDCGEPGKSFMSLLAS